MHALVDTVLAQEELSGELMENLVGVLGALCSVRKSKFYIPGETFETGELRRKAMEKGVFTVLRWVHARTHDDQMRRLIHDSVFRHLTIRDYLFYKRVLKGMLDDAPRGETLADARGEVLAMSEASLEKKKSRSVIRIKKEDGDGWTKPAKPDFSAKMRETISGEEELKNLEMSIQEVVFVF